MWRGTNCPPGILPKKAWFLSYALFNLSVDIVWSLGAVSSNKKMENEMRQAIKGI